MDLTKKQVQWTAIVVGATCYFFLGGLTDLGFPIQLGSFVGLAFVVPAIVTRTASFQQPSAVDGSGSSDDEYRF